MSWESNHMEDGHKQLRILAPDQQDYPEKDKEGFHQKQVQDNPADHG